MAKKSINKRPPYPKRARMVSKAGDPDVPRPKSPYPKGPKTKLR